MYLRKILLSFFAVTVSFFSFSQTSISLSLKQVRLKWNLNKNGSPEHAVFWRNQTVIKPLLFLDKGKTYIATIYRDADNADWKTNPEAYTIEKRTVTAATVLELKMAPGGGVAISFVPVMGSGLK